MPSKSTQEAPLDPELGKKVLLYSASQDSLTDYAHTFERIGVNYDTVPYIRN